jgi:tetratricopeptide (TPR) repeat protein
MKIFSSSKVLIVSLIVLFHFTWLSAFISRDTIPQTDQTGQNNNNSTPKKDYNLLLSNGYLLIKGNNFEDGIKYLCEGFKLKGEQEKSDRVEDLQSYEFIDILNILNSGKLKKEEARLGYQFVKEATTDKYSAGEADLNKYLAKNPNSLFCRRLKFLYLITKPDGNSMNTYVDKLLELDSTIVSANLFKGRLLGFEGKLDESIKCFSRAIRYSPKYALAYYLRALTYDELQNNQKAVEDYSTAIELYPNYFDAYNNRGNAKLKLNQPKEALADYRIASNLRPDSDWPYLNMALVYRKLNMNDSALVFIQDALDINPRNALALDNKAEIYLREQDYGSAVENYTKSINLEPSNKFAYIGRGDAYLFDNKTPQAMQDFEKALDLDKKNAYALMRLGDCYYHDKNYEKAIQFYERSQKIYPENLYLLVTKGLAYNQIGRNEAAKKSLLEAVTLDSTNSPALGNLGWIYYCLGDFENCILYSQKAIRYQNDAFYAMFNIALSTLRLGKYEESIELYKKYISLSTSQNKENLSGAMSDLRDLIKQNIKVKESTYILENLFQAKD